MPVSPPYQEPFSAGVQMIRPSPPCIRYLCGVALIRAMPSLIGKNMFFFILPNSFIFWTISSIVELRFIAIRNVPYRQAFCRLAPDFSKQSGTTVTSNFLLNNSSPILLFKSFSSILFPWSAREVQSLEHCLRLLI